MKTLLMFISLVTVFLCGCTTLHHQGEVYPLASLNASEQTLRFNAAENAVKKILSMGKIKNEIEKAKTGASDHKFYIKIAGAQDRTLVFTYLLERSLRLAKCNVAANEKDADYIIQIYVKQDGVDSEIFNALYLYISKLRTAKVTFIVDLVENNTSNIIESKTIEGSFEYQEDYVLVIFGPIYSSLSNQKPVDDEVSASVTAITPVPATSTSTSQAPAPGNDYYVGVGIVFDESGICVKKTIPDSPASNSGILQGDTIVWIDGENISGYGNSGHLLKSKLKGEAGSKVNIKISRKGMQDPIDITLERAKIHKTAD